PAASADLVVILMQEGLAHIFLVGKSVTTTRSRIEVSIPRKHGPAIAGYESALKKFFENVLQAFLKHVDFKVVRCAVIASSGFTKDQFHRHLLHEAERRQLRAIIENKSKIILVHTTSGYKYNNECHLEAQLKGSSGCSKCHESDKRYESSTRGPSSQGFLRHAIQCQLPERACYGPKHVEVAHERMAIQTLLITDELFRNADVPTRQKYVNLVTSVKDSGGNAHIFSSMHVSGEQLAQLTGIAAILRFPLPDLEDIEM
ncbi:PELOTA 1-like protein, partial [Drosera capensis]